MWLGLKHAKQGGLKIRVETYMESRWWRVKALPTGNEKPLMVLSRQWQGQICDVWMGTRLEAESRERRLLDGWGKRLCRAEQGSGRRRRGVGGFKKYTGGQPRIPALPCIINLVSLYKLIHFLSLIFLIRRMGIRTFLATGCQGMKFCY